MYGASGLWETTAGDWIAIFLGVRMLEGRIRSSLGARHSLRQLSGELDGRLRMVAGESPLGWSCSCTCPIARPLHLPLPLRAI